MYMYIVYMYMSIMGVLVSIIIAWMRGGYTI